MTSKCPLLRQQMFTFLVLEMHNFFSLTTICNQKCIHPTKLSNFKGSTSDSNVSLFKKNNWNMLNFYTKSFVWKFSEKDISKAIVYRYPLPHLASLSSIIAHISKKGPMLILDTNINLNIIFRDPSSILSPNTHSSTTKYFS